MFGRLWFFLTRWRQVRDLDEEMRLHVDHRAAANRRDGLHGEEAERQARVRFGNLLKLREEARDAWGFVALEHTFGDLRYAWRTLWRSRAFTATALVVLAVGIGANTAIYTVVRGIALRPLPFHDPDRLMLVGELSPAGRREAVAPANFVDLTQRSRTFELMAMHRGARLILTGVPVVESVSGVHVSHNFFTVLGVQPQFGRTFLSQGDQSDAARVAMLSHAGWERLFSQDRGVVGRAIRLDGTEYTVIGVLPPGFSLWNAEVWVAGFDPALLASRVTHNVGAIGRLARGATVDQARAELDTLGRQLGLAYPESNKGWTFRTVPLQEAWLGEYRSSALLLLAAVGLVLLIACSNLANLLLERSLAREREMSLRLALGASRLRITRQVLTESMLLGLLGGIAGVLVAYWSLGVLTTLIPANTLSQIPGGAGAIRLDLHTLGVAAILVLSTGLVFGLAPALRLGRAAAKGGLREAARGASSDREGRLWRRGLVVSQIGLSAVLLTGATLLIISFWQLQRLDRGYDADRGLSFTVMLPQDRYSEPARRDEFFRTALDRLRVLPGVTRAGAMTLLSSRGRPFVPEGTPPVSRDAAPQAIYRVASSDYLPTIGIPLVRGRQFTAADGPEAPAVAIVNQTLARTVWPNDDPVGRRIQLLAPQADRWVTVVGVAGDVRESLDPRFPLRLEPQPAIYRPTTQEAVAGMSFVLRTEQDPLALAAAVRREIATIDATIPVLMLQSLRQHLNESIATPRFHALLLVGFAGLALLLATVGVYGVVSYAVHQRTHEIGIRIAIGASSGDILRATVGEGLLLALVGVAVGLVGALGAVRLLASSLYGVGPTEPLVLVFVSVVLVMVATTASYLPARRAAATDPLVALRHE